MTRIPLLYTLPCRSLTPEELTLSMQLNVLARSVDDSIIDALLGSPTADAGWPKSMPAVARIPKLIGKPVHTLVLVWVMALCGAFRERVLLWAWTLKHLKISGNRNDWYVWSVAFPNGVPTDASYQDAWDAQIVNGAALLDKPETWV